MKARLIKPSRDMSDKEYARWLNETVGLPFDEACRMAGWNPREEYKEAALNAFFAILSIAAVAFALWVVPFAHATEQPQLTESAMISCLNKGGMVINGELWVCSNTGMKP